MTRRKRFGQHFLEPAWVTRVVQLIAPSRDDTVLEIGPGRGALTLALAPRVKRLIGIEIDRDLVRELGDVVGPSVELVAADFLDVDLEDLLGSADGPVRVVGNLPYNVSSPILFRLLSAHRSGTRIADATLMLQAEVAARLAAPPGGGDYGVLALQTALHADVTRLLTLPPGAFRPPPKVTSAVVAMRFHAPRVDVGRPDTFEQLVRGMFMQRRKTLLNALRPVTGLQPAALREALLALDIDPGRRPETLRLDEAAALSKWFSAPLADADGDGRS